MSHITIRFTALVEITSNGSGGRAKILFGHPALTAGASDPSLTNRLFSQHPVGTRMIAVIHWLPTRRRLVTANVVETHEPVWTTVGFADGYAETLQKSAEKYEAHYGKAPVAKAETLVRTPSGTNWFDGYYINNEDLEAFEVASKISSTHPIKILMSGPSGYGKTTTAEAFAKANEMNYVRFNTALVADPEEFFGFRSVEGGELVFVKSEFTKAIEQGNTVVVLDELNRASPEMHNAIFPILDDDAETTVFGQHIKVAPNTIIVATVNLGFQFTGTFQLDQALVNRMDMVINVGALPAAVERKVLKTRVEGLLAPDASRIVSINNKIRKLNDSGKVAVDASTRTSLKVAKLVANGLTIERAFGLVVINGADADERKELIDSISSTIEFESSDSKDFDSVGF